MTRTTSLIIPFILFPAAAYAQNEIPQPIQAPADQTAPDGAGGGDIIEITHNGDDIIDIPDDGDDIIDIPDDGDDIIDIPDDGKTDAASDNSAIELETVQIDAAKSRAIYRQETPFIQEINTSAVQSINDWLEQVPGVYGDSTGKGQRLVLVRGFSTRQLSARFDDIPLDTGYDGITGLDTLPMNWIGGGAFKHADAHNDDAVGLGGGIQMYSITPKIAEAAFETSLTGAAFSAGHGMKIGPWDWAVTAGGKYSNGFRLSHAYKPNKQEDGGMRDASKSSGYNALAKVARDLGSWGRLELMGGYTESPREVPTGVGTGYYRYWKFTKWHTALASAKLKFDTDYLNGSWRLWFQDQSNRLSAFDNPERTTQTGLTSWNTDWQDYDIGTILFLASPPITTDAGTLDVSLRTEIRYQTHDSHEHQPGPDKIIDKNSSRIYFDIRPGIEWQIIAPLFINASVYAVGDAELTHGDTSKPVKDLKELYNGGFNFGIDYIPRTDLKLSLRAARRLRMPTLKEQFSRAPESPVQDFALNAEVGWNVQLQIDYTPFETLKFQVTGYETEVRDLISYRYIEGLKEAYNVDKARIAGIDIAAHAGPFWGLSLDVAYGWLYAQDLDKNLVLTDRPAHNFRATLTYAPIDQLAISIRAQYESKRRTEAWLSAQSAWIDGVFLLDAQIEYKMPWFTAYIRGTNLLDYNYSRSFGYPEPGFQLFIGGKIALDKPQS